MSGQSSGRRRCRFSIASTVTWPTAPAPLRTGFRLRCGDYRVFFDLKDENTIEITGVKNRREAYR